MESPPRQPSRRLEVGLLLILVLSGLALRLYRIDSWQFDPDEFSTLMEIRDQQRGHGSTFAWVRASSPLTHSLIGLCYGAIKPPTVALRLVPLIFGVLTLIATYPLVRALWGSRVALIHLALLALSPLPIYTSSFARYQSPTFFCGAMTFLCVACFAARKRPGLSFFFALFFFALACGFHLSSVLLVLPGFIGLAFVPLLTKGRPRKPIALGVGLFVVLCAIAYFIKREDITHVTTNMLRGFRYHDIGYGPFRLLGSLFFQIGPGICLFAALGTIAALRHRDSSAILAATFVAIPVVDLMVVAAHFAAGPRYLHAALPGVFILAALSLAHMMKFEGRRALFARGALIGLALIPQAPTLISNLSNENSRYWIKGAAYQLNKNVPEKFGPGAIFGESHALLSYYARKPSREMPRRKEDLAPLVEGKKRVFLVAYFQRGRLTGTTDPELQRYLESRCYCLHRYVSNRIDLYRFEVRLYSNRDEPR